MIPAYVPLGLAVLGFLIVLGGSVRLRRCGVNPWSFTARDDAQGFVGRVFVALSGSYAALLLFNALDQTTVQRLFGVWTPLPAAWGEGGGTALIAVGLGLVVWAQSAMGRSWRVGIPEHERTSLVVHGPFRFSRNPVFLGFLLGALGVAIAVPSALAWALLSATYVSISVQVRLEEEHLRSLHPNVYPLYEGAVPRWFPARVGGTFKLPPDAASA